MLTQLLLRTSATCLLVLAALGCRASDASPPAPPVLSSTVVDATVPLEFTQIGTVRELADGRLIVADERENRLLVVDFATEAARDLGRVGDGPGEYRQSGPLSSLAGDSTLMLDINSRRWLLLHEDEIVATLATSDPAVAVVARGLLVGVDHRGSAVAVVTPRTSPGRGGGRAFTDVVRVKRTSGAVTPIGRAGSGAENRFSEVAAGGAADPNEKPKYMMSIATRDQVAVFPDGWVAIVRSHPYQVEWCDRASRCSSGPILRPEPDPITQEEKAAYLSLASANSAWPPTTNIDETTGWPSTMPPFGSFERRTYPTSLLPVPDGRLIVQRLPGAGVAEMRYDVIDRTGRIIQRLRLPANSQFVGAGLNLLYVVTTDALGVQHLERHRWP